MEEHTVFCTNCKRTVSPVEKVNYPMTVGILVVLAAITFVFVGVTFLEHDFSQAETVALTLLVTVVPFGYMRVTRMKPVIYSCPLCGADPTMHPVPEAPEPQTPTTWWPADQPSPAPDYPR